MDDSGRVVVISGASSSGKSSIAGALLPMLPGPWFLVPVDAIGAMRSPTGTPEDPEDLEAVLRRTRRGYHRMVAALASVGCDVVMDYPLSERWRLDDLAEVLAGYDVLVVEVRCDPDELDRRERDRRDRPAGLATSQRFVYEHGVRDLLVDTTARTAEDCAGRIAAGLGSTAGRALEQYRRSRLDQA